MLTAVLIACTARYSVVQDAWMWMLDDPAKHVGAEHKRAVVWWPEGHTAAQLSLKGPNLVEDGLELRVSFQVKRDAPVASVPDTACDSRTAYGIGRKCTAAVIVTNHTNPCLAMPSLSLSTSRAGP